MAITSTQTNPGDLPKVELTLTGVNSTGATASYLFSDIPMPNITIQAHRTAGSDEISLKIEGSLDGSNWIDISGTQTSSSGELMFHIVNKPLKYIRANITSIGSSTYTIYLLAER